MPGSTTGDDANAARPGSVSADEGSVVRECCAQLVGVGEQQPIEHLVDETLRVVDDPLHVEPPVVRGDQGSADTGQGMDGHPDRREFCELLPVGRLSAR